MGLVVLMSQLFTTELMMKFLSIWVWTGFLVPFINFFRWQRGVRRRNSSYKIDDFEAMIEWMFGEKIEPITKNLNLCSYANHSVFPEFGTKDQLKGQTFLLQENFLIFFASLVFHEHQFLPKKLIYPPSHYESSKLPKHILTLITLFWWIRL